MYENKKIEEAEYFYLKMCENDKYLEFNLSAFLTAARSVLQYALNEAKAKNGQYWHDSYISINPILKFFKDIRDINIHIKSIKPLSSITIYASPINITLSISGDATFNSNIIKKASSTKTNKPKYQNKLPTKEYFIEEWSGKEDLFTLCKEYIKTIKIFIKDGQKKGYIT